MKNSKQPLISVIVPVYKTESTLRRCLDSICGQSYSNLEIICINDGSPDNSELILAEYAEKDQRIKIVTQENQGLSAARNRGLELATGEWVTGVDSDDFIALDTFEYCLPMMEDLKVSIICYGTEIVVGAKYSSSAYFSLPAKGKQGITSELLCKTNVCFVTKLYRKQLIDKCNARFPVGLWFEDEAFFNILAPYVDIIAYLPDKKYKYVQIPGEETIMSKAIAGDPKVLDLLKVMDYILARYSTSPLPKSLSNHIKYVLKHYYICLIWRVEKHPNSDPLIWDMYRQIVQKYDLESLCQSDLILSVLYYCPPRCYRKNTRMLASMENIDHREGIILQYPAIYRRYIILKTKKVFSWGKRKIKYKTKIRELKSKIREYRAIFRQHECKKI